MFWGHRFLHIFLNRFLDAFSHSLARFWLPFGALWLRLAPFWLPLASFCLPFVSLWLPFGFLLAPFSSLFAPFGSTLLLQAPSRFVLGSSWCILGAPFGPSWVQMAAKMQPKPRKWHQKAPKLISRQDVIFQYTYRYITYPWIYPCRYIK